MIVILAIDDRRGLLFNGRRQSQDKRLRERILEITEGKVLWMNPYSQRQFGEGIFHSRAVVDEAFLSKAERGEYCFVENMELKPYLEKIERLILFKWNRSYPADRYLDIDLSDERWQLEEVQDFPGFSHEKITEEIYRNEKY